MLKHHFVLLRLIQNNCPGVRVVVYIFILVIQTNVSVNSKSGGYIAVVRFHAHNRGDKKALYIVISGVVYSNLDKFSIR